MLYICQFYAINMIQFFFLFLSDHQEIAQREKEGQLDEGFLAEVNAQLRQVSPVNLHMTDLAKLCFITMRFQTKHSKLLKLTIQYLLSCKSVLQEYQHFAIVTLLFDI